MNRFLLFLATGFGAGFSPVVPGTAGTLVAIPLCLLITRIPSPLFELTVVTFFFFSSWISDRAQTHWGRKDDRRIVIDEIMGFLITITWVPQTVLSVTLAFFLFRLFDIVKPPPIRRLEKVKMGYGVVLDDLLAGVYANIVLRVILFIVARH
jgi:phosphatidylglycerophosphatase A